MFHKCKSCPKLVEYGLTLKLKFDEVLTLIPSRTIILFRHEID